MMYEVAKGGTYALQLGTPASHWGSGGPRPFPINLARVRDWTGGLGHLQAGKS